MNIILSIYWILIAAGWYFIMGLLHDIFVIKNHKGPYDRELLRLLMDGHVLMLSGVLLAVCFFMLQKNIQYGAWIALITGIGMIVYCLMIWPFLKSIVTLLISVMVIIVAARFAMMLN
jgi:hypothetical protein